MKSEVIKLYPDRDDVTLTTYILDDSKETRNGRPRPAVVICPGGGYLNVSDREAEPVALKFLSMGYHAFVLRYSVYSKGGQEPIDYLKPFDVKKFCKYPAQIRELGRSMLIVREHAQEWHIDRDKIAICGFSAGAHNCALYSVYWDKEIITDYLKADAKELRPNACILGYPLTDYVYMNSTKGNNQMADGLFAISNIAFLGEQEVSEDKLKEISPAGCVSESVPPTFIWATANDELVDIQHSIIYSRALADNKIPFELHIFEDGKHGLSVADQTSSEAAKEVQPLIQYWVPAVNRWLQKRFEYELPEKTAMDIMMEDMQKQYMES